MPKHLMPASYWPVTGLIIIGVAIGMSLIQEDLQLLDTFTGITGSPNEIYYFGELILHPACRNNGMGQKLLAQMEDHIRSHGCYNKLACAPPSSVLLTPLVTSRFYPNQPIFGPHRFCAATWGDRTLHLVLVR